MTGKLPHLRTYTSVPYLMSDKFYSILHKLDSGAEGAAYLVQHRTTSRFYVMKRMTCTANEERYRMARREAQLLKVYHIQAFRR